MKTSPLSTIENQVNLHIPFVSWSPFCSHVGLQNYLHKNIDGSTLAMEAKMYRRIHIVKKQYSL